MDCIGDIYAEDIAGLLGQILDEVDLPPDISDQVQDLYDRASRYL